jgi:hypothetical protein
MTKIRAFEVPWDSLGFRGIKSARSYINFERDCAVVLRETYGKTPFRPWHIELQHHPQQIGT